MKLSNILILSSAMVTLSAAQAFAAGQATDWSGPYVGINVGAVVNGNTNFDRTTGSSPNNVNALTQNLRPTEHEIGDSGFTVGGQVGYNFQPSAMFGNHVVFGVEADIAYTDLDRTDTLTNTTMIGPLGAPSAVPVTRINQYRGQLDYLGTVRGRVGYSFDRTLIYATGGLAYGRAKREVIFYGPNAPTEPYFQGQENGTKTGWAAGAGLEYALSSDTFLNPWHSSGATMRVEYMHYDLGDDTLVYPGVNSGAALGSYTSRVRTDGDVVRVGLNYKF